MPKLSSTIIQSCQAALVATISFLNEDNSRLKKGIIDEQHTRAKGPNTVFFR